VLYSRLAATFPQLDRKEEHIMVTSTEQRHQLIAEAVRQQPDAAAGAGVPATSVLRWRQLARQLCPIIGDAGFMALYMRSLHVVRNQYGWLPRHETLSADAAFTLLEQALQSRDAAAAGGASTALLCVFIDTLILLIGELLTTSILREAWGDDVENHAGTELP
jgi:hypothetical protein